MGVPDVIITCWSVFYVCKLTILTFEVRPKVNGECSEMNIIIAVDYWLLAICFLLLCFYVEWSRWKKEI